MSDAFRVIRSFVRFDEQKNARRTYPRGYIISPKEAVHIRSLPTLEAAGSIYRMPEELARELQKRPNERVVPNDA